MSTDLKRKLRDPEFVATRCDLDGSGDLNPHELKQAARVYGISAGDPRLQGLQVIRQRMGKKGFAKLVASESGGKLHMRLSEYLGISRSFCVQLDLTFFEIHDISRQFPLFNGEFVDFCILGGQVAPQFKKPGMTRQIIIDTHWLFWLFGAL